MSRKPRNLARLCHSKRWLYGVSSHSERLRLFQEGFTHRDRHLPPVSSKGLLGMSGDRQAKTNEHIEYRNEVMNIQRRTDKVRMS